MIFLKTNNTGPSWINVLMVCGCRRVYCGIIVNEDCVVHYGQKEEGIHHKTEQ